MDNNSVNLTNEKIPQKNNVRDYLTRLLADIENQKELYELKKEELNLKNIELTNENNVLREMLNQQTLVKENELHSKIEMLEKEIKISEDNAEIIKDLKEKNEGLNRYCEELESQNLTNTELIQNFFKKLGDDESVRVLKDEHVNLNYKLGIMSEKFDNIKSLKKDNITSAPEFFEKKEDLKTEQLKETLSSLNASLDVMSTKIEKQGQLIEDLSNYLYLEKDKNQELLNDKEVIQSEINKLTNLINNVK